MGLELGVEAQLTSTFKLKGAAAIGQFTYDNNPNLFLTTEILELDKPTILVLNMDDERAQAGKTINAQQLSAQTGCPVIATTAVHGKGLNQVIEQIQLMLSGSGRVTHYYAELPEGLTLPAASTRSEAVTKYLSELKIGETSTIQGFDTSRIDDKEFAADLEDRLLEIGFEEGLAVELLHQGPINRDPIAVKIGNMTVALRRVEADAIILIERKSS